MSAKFTITIQVELSDELIMQLAAMPASPNNSTLEELLRAMRQREQPAAKNTAAADHRLFTIHYPIEDGSLEKSFSIETPSPEFLGECGIEILKKQNNVAFEIWMFDKNDIKTATKIWSTLTSMDGGFYDELATRGHPIVLIAENEPMIIESETLRLTAIASNIQMDGQTVTSADFSFSWETK